MLPTIAREADAVVMIDQRKLPSEEVYVRCKTAPEVARAIKTMVIRGAPAIGVAAAMGIALGMRRSKATGTQKFAAEFHKTCELMASTRPTAVNLFWAIERMRRAFAAAALAGESVDQIKDRLDAESTAILNELWAGNQIENRYSHWIWRQYASAFWDDIRIGRVLPFKAGKDEDDEKHVHPLQLDVIDRVITLWSNPGEKVLTPFMGVGSEVYGAVINGRRGIGVELKSTVT
jgi:hypothetical protein